MAKMNKENNATHWVLATALLLIGAFVIIALVMIRSEAQDITATINNVAPVPDGASDKICLGSTTGDNASISACSELTSITLTAGTTTSISYFVQVSDTNGIDDVEATGTGVMFDDNTQTSACTDDNNDCYSDSACAKITPAIDATTAWFRCDFSLQYYANPTTAAGEWDVSFSVDDNAAATGTLSTYTTEVDELVAGTFPTVAYGTVALGFTSATGDNQEVTHTNNGNVTLDIQVALDDDDTNAAVDCTTGEIDVTNFTFDRDQSGTPGDLGYSAATKTLATTAQDIDIDISQRTNDSAVQGPTNPRISYGAGGDDSAYSYWNINVPASGVLGSCSEELNVTFKQAP